MSETGPSENTFAKVFIPGLILGLIVGMAIGAIVPVFLSGSPEIRTQPGVHSTPGPRDREGGSPDTTTKPVQPSQDPAAQAPAPGTKPEEKPGDKPGDKPADKPGDKPTQPAPTTPPAPEKPKS